MRGKKIACLGGGSLYFTHVLSDLAATEGLGGSEVTLYDLDLEKAEIVAATGRRLTEEGRHGIRVRACRELADAVDGADFAVSAIGGGGAGDAMTIYGSRYHLMDMLIPARYGIYQIVGDTGGPAALMMGLRTISIYLDLAAEFERRCPDVVFVNHSNPMAALCRAMWKHTKVKATIGLCHGVQIGINHVAAILDVPAAELETVWIGTNHYYWFTRIRHRGRDLYPELWRRLAERGTEPGRVLSQQLSELYGYKIVYPQDDHVVEFYPFLAQVRDPRELPYELEAWVDFTHLDPGPQPEPTGEARRAQRESYLAEFRAAVGKATLGSPSADPTKGEGVGRLLAAIANGERAVHIVNVPNRGAVPNLPPEAILEVEGVTDSLGVRPVYAGEAPIALAGLLHKRIAWQELVADAAATGDRRLALQALMLDEMAIQPDHASRMLDELLAASAPMLPRFA